jgi:chromate reductase
MTAHTLLGISGSLRKEATNKLLVREAARLYGDAEYTEADLNLPLFNEDLEEAEGIPAPVQRLADQIAAADAVLIPPANTTSRSRAFSRTRSTG